MILTAEVVNLKGFESEVANRGPDGELVCPVVFPASSNHNLILNGSGRVEMQALFLLSCSWEWIDVILAFFQFNSK